MSTNLPETQITDLDPIDMKRRQDPLMKSYRDDLQLGWVIDSATTSSKQIPASHPLHTQVTFGTGHPCVQRIGIHSAVGGECDFPNPGETLSAAVASCLDATLRIVANRLGIPLIQLAVQVDAKVDVRGTLRVDPGVQVGFQSINIGVDIQAAKGVSGDQINMLLKAAEYSCVVLQTLRRPPEIRLTRAVVAK